MSKQKNKKSASKAPSKAKKQNTPRKGSASSSRPKTSQKNARSTSKKGTKNNPKNNLSKKQPHPKKRGPKLRIKRLFYLSLLIFFLSGGLGALIFLYGSDLLPVIQQITNNEKINQLTNVSHAQEVQKIKQQNALDEVDISGFSDQELRNCFYSLDLDDNLVSRLQNMGYTGQIPISSLKYVRVLYYDYENRPTIGELVVNAEMAKPVENVFFDLFLHKYQIARMILPDAYGTRISESYADNNTVALCFGLTDDNRGSVHAQGYAIDLNPLQNPLIKDNGSSFSVFPMEGQLFLDRSVNSPHFIHEKDYAVEAFAKEGFDWTGDIEGINDYKHFEYTKVTLPPLPEPHKPEEDKSEKDSNASNASSQEEAIPPQEVPEEGEMENQAVISEEYEEPLEEDSLELENEE